MGTKSVSMRANCMQLLIWVSVYDSGQSTVSIHRVFLFSMSFRLGKWYEARDKHTRCVWYYISFYRHWFARLSHSLRIKGVHIWTLPFESRMRFKKLATLKSQETLFRCFASSMERGGLLFTLHAERVKKMGDKFQRWKILLKTTAQGVCFRSCSFSHTHTKLHTDIQPFAIWFLPAETNHPGKRFRVILSLSLRSHLR